MQDLQILFESQNGLCAYTGIPMCYGSYHNNWWTLSIERKNVTRGYELDNICFICWEFNTPNRVSNGDRAVSVSDITGSSMWSLKKIEYIKQINT